MAEKVTINVNYYSGELRIIMNKVLALKIEFRSFKNEMMNIPEMNFWKVSPLNSALACHVYTDVIYVHVLSFTWVT